MVSGIVGGLGLFLLGMLLLTENLKAVASDSLHRILKRFTSKTWTGILTGVGITSLLQSSSATTLITVGLVSSGLLSFTQSLGIIYGANLGTTSTAWIVSGLGLKVSMTAMSLPLLGIGAFLRIFLQGAWRHLGLVIAGFAMIFLGIDFLQLSMADLSEKIDIGGFVSPGWGGRFSLLLVGLLMTVVMQSSSAAVAVTMTLLYAGVIPFELAAAMVIGQSIGTTVTAGFASLAGSVQAKRTALAHILFNVVTGTIVFLSFPIFIKAVLLLANWLFGDQETLSLAVFQTSFHLLGISIFLPFTSFFARQIERLLPDRRSIAWVPRLEKDSPLGQEQAIEVGQKAVFELTRELLTLSQQMLKTGLQNKQRYRLLDLREALRESSSFVASSEFDEDREDRRPLRLRIFHAFEHLERILELLAQSHRLHEGAEGSAYRERLSEYLQEFLNEMGKENERLQWGHRAQLELDEDYAKIKGWFKAKREEMLQAVSQKRLPIQDCNRFLTELFLCMQLAKHFWRILRSFQTSEEVASLEGKEEGLQELSRASEL